MSNASLADDDLTVIAALAAPNTSMHPVRFAGGQNNLTSTVPPVRGTNVGSSVDGWAVYVKENVVNSLAPLDTVPCWRPIPPFWTGGQVAL